MAAVAGTHRRGLEVHAPGLLRLVSDERLVAMVRAGSQPAFEQIYERHHRGILSFCRHMLGSPHEAEDAVQHTFLSAYGDLVDSDKPIQLRPWLYAIARNRSLTMLRARREKPADDLDEAVPSTDNLAVEVQRRQDLRELLVDMRRLPDDQRAALVLAELGDLSHEDIGEVIGVPKDKVKALVFQAREALVSSRAARATPCAEIREEIANARGAALRRTALRRHLHDCAACSSFREEIAEQRKALRQIMPVAPSAALKGGALPWLLGGGGGAIAGGAAGGGAVAGGGVAAKVLATVAAVSAVAGGAVAIDLRDGGGPSSAAGATGTPISPVTSAMLNGSTTLRASVPQAGGAPTPAGAGSGPAVSEDKKPGGPSGGGAVPLLGVPGGDKTTSGGGGGNETGGKGGKGGKGKGTTKLIGDAPKKDAQSSPSAGGGGDGTSTPASGAPTSGGQGGSGNGGDDQGGDEQGGGGSGGGKGKGKGNGRGKGKGNGKGNNGNGKGNGGGDGSNGGGGVQGGGGGGESGGGDQGGGEQGGGGGGGGQGDQGGGGEQGGGGQAGGGGNGNGGGKGKGGDGGGKGKGAGGD